MQMKSSKIIFFVLLIWGFWGWS